MQKLRQLYQQNPIQSHLIIFISAFVFDWWMLSKPDSLLVIAQQVVYLAFMFVILILMGKGELTLKPLAAKAWSYHLLALHFLMGSLLSLYTLFFFKSASIWNSFAFLSLIVLLLVLNELPQFHRLSVALKWGLVTLLSLCFFNLISPLIFRQIGVWIFVIGCALCALLFFVLDKYFVSFWPEREKRDCRAVVAAVFGVWIVCYLMNWTPPVPLAIEKAGIYHLIERQDQNYILSYERPSWKFWENGAQTFVRRPGDEVYYYARVFAPAYFVDQVYAVWKYKDPQQSWVVSDKIPLKLSGGREQGYRLFTKKRNIQAGSWRVELQTEDQREIGRVYFSVSDSSEARNVPFQTDIE